MSRHDTLNFLLPIKTLTRFIEENSRNSPDLWKNMNTVTLLQQLQRDMYTRFEEYFGNDYTHEMRLKDELDKLSERLTVVYTDIVNEINHKAQSRLSHFSIKEVPIPVMDTILRDEYMKKDHSGLRVLLTQLNTVSLGTKHSNLVSRTKHLNRASGKKHSNRDSGTKHSNRASGTKDDYKSDDDAWHDHPEPDDDIRHFDDPDDDVVDEYTTNISGDELERMRPSIISAIEMLRRYDYSMFPSIKYLIRKEPALAKSMCSYLREKCQKGLACLDRHDYHGARFNLQHVIKDIQYFHFPSIEKSDLESPAARRRH